MQFLSAHAAKLALVLLLLCRATAAESLDAWQDRLTFHASFDVSSDADFAAGDGRIYTASSLDRQNIQPGIGTDAVSLSDQGRYGACLRFHDTTDEVIMFQGKDNVPYDTGPHALTISFWMRLSPDKDLKPGYVDPLQITDKQWNNAALFVDFTKDDQPRHFRLGVFSDYTFWNPQDTDWEQIAAADRPMVTVTQPPFDRDRWTHVVITLAAINAENEAGAATLYLDGALQGTLKRPQHFSWNPERVAIMLGIKYIGAIDDFAVFSGAMSPAEVGLLMALPRGVASLR